MMIGTKTHRPVNDGGVLVGSQDISGYALLAGRSGGQTLIGGTASGNSLTLQSTSNATKGKILFGTSGYDEVNNRLGLGTPSPSTVLEISNSDPRIVMRNGSTRDLTIDADFGGVCQFNFRRSTGAATIDFNPQTDAGVGDATFRFFRSTITSGSVYYDIFIGDGTGTQNARLGGNTDTFFAMSTGNVGIGINNFGSAQKALGIKNGTAPSSSVTDSVLVYAADVSSSSELFVRDEATRVEQISGLRARNSAQFDMTNNTTLADVTGLSKGLLAGVIYAFKAVLFYDADATGGHKYAIAGTATATSIKYHIRSISDATSALVITSRQTALAGSAGQAGSTAGLTIIEGVIAVNAAGTLTVQFAQNAENGTSSILTGSYMEIIPIG